MDSTDVEAQHVLMIVKFISTTLISDNMQSLVDNWRKDTRVPDRAVALNYHGIDRIRFLAAFSGTGEPC
jgi:hypothetical protein